MSERFWARVEGGDVDTCWEWVAGKSGGYGVFRVQGTPIPAHRYAYEELREAIPTGLVIDHLCRNRACVNPWHLEPVTNAVNVRRGGAAIRTHCPQGHGYTPENTHRRSNGKRECRTCMRDRSRRRRAAEQTPTQPKEETHVRMG